MEDNNINRKEENTMDNQPTLKWILIFILFIAIAIIYGKCRDKIEFQNSDTAKFLEENKREWDELRDRIHNAATELEENKKILERIENGEYIESETEFTYEHHLIMLKDIKKEIKAAKQAAEKGEAEKLDKIYILTQAYIDGYESGLFYPESIDDIVTIHKMLGEAKEEFEKSKDISKINDVILFIDDIVDK